MENCVFIKGGTNIKVGYGEHLHDIQLLLLLLLFLLARWHNVETDISEKYVIAERHIQSQYIVSFCIIKNNTSVTRF